MAMIRAWAEIAKVCGFHSGRQKVEIRIGGEGLAMSAKFAAMSDAELLAIADGRSDLSS